MTASTDAMGVTATNTYDAANRLLSTSYSDGATLTVSYTYDANGRRTSMTDGTGTTTYQYDSLGHVTVLGDGNGRIIKKRYDLAGDVTSLQYPNGHTVAMQYDGDGQMTGVTRLARQHHPVPVRRGGKPHLVQRERRRERELAVRRRQPDPPHHESDANGVPYATFDYTRAADGRGITAVDSTGLGQPAQSYSYDLKDGWARRTGIS